MGAGGSATILPAPPSLQLLPGVRNPQKSVRIALASADRSEGDVRDFVGFCFGYFVFVAPRKS